MKKHVIVVLLFLTITSFSFTQNYYEIPYVGETSKLEELTGTEKDRLIQHYGFQRTINQFMPNMQPITGELKSIYREIIPSNSNATPMTAYRLMYLITDNINKTGETSLNFNENDRTKHKTYGQVIYIENMQKTKSELFYQQIYFGDQWYHSINNAFGVAGSNVLFRIIGEDILSVEYFISALHSARGLDEDGSDFDRFQNAKIFRDKIINIMDKTKLCEVEASFPLVDKNNPYRYSIQNAFDGNPATSFVEDTDDDLFEILCRFNFLTTKEDESVEISKVKLLNGYAQNERLYLLNNRLKKFNFNYSPADEFARKAKFYDIFANEILPNKLGYYEKAFTPMRFNSITLVGTDIYHGEQYSDTCISELDYFSNNNGWLFGGIGE